MGLASWRTLSIAKAARLRFVTMMMLLTVWDMFVLHLENRSWAVARVGS